MTFIAVSLFALCIIQAWCIRLLEKIVDHWKNEAMHNYKDSLDNYGELHMRRRAFDGFIEAKGN